MKSAGVDFGGVAGPRAVPGSQQPGTLATLDPTHGACAFDRAARRGDSRSALRRYIQAFLSHSEHRDSFDQNPEEVLEGLMDPDRISIPLMPVDKHMSVSGDSQARDAWYFRYVQTYTRHHKKFINDLPAAWRRRLYEAKLLRHPREKNLRHFLAKLASYEAEQMPAERRFFNGLDLGRNLAEQGVEVKDCADYSSGRGYDEGAIVNQVILKRNRGRVTLFLKGTGKIRKQKLEKRGIKGFESFEVTAFEAASIVGLNSIPCGFYPDEGDPMMTGYTLLQEIPGINSNALFRLLPRRRFAIRPEFARYQDRFIQEFARTAALGDVLRKNDRIIMQVLHPEYDANYMVNPALLGQTERDAVYTIDNNHLFARDNHGLLHDIKWGRCTEIGIVSAFEGFYTDPNQREEMLGQYERAYLQQWAKIKLKQPALEKLMANVHGAGSKEYGVFQRAMQSDPRKEFGEQKAELLRTLPA